MSVNYKKIMVTLDGSDFAAQALPTAQMLAEHFKAELILFSVVPEARVADSEFAHEFLHLSDKHPDDRQQELVDHAANALDFLVEDLKLHQIKVEGVVDIGSPPARIVDYAKENGVDLIVMTTHGRTGLARWVYGSVADKVLRGAACSVFLVRGPMN